jgi:hypothetical protein
MLHQARAGTTAYTRKVSVANALFAPHQSRWRVIAPIAREETVPITQEDKTAKAREMLSDLYQLVEALDRRVPHIERIGEAQIAHDAADLRERAVSLIQRIEGKTPKE